MKTAKSQKDRLKYILIKYHMFYIMMMPGLIFLLIFKYLPMYGLIISFQDFNIFSGVNGSPWVGFAQFQRLFQSHEFYQVFRNTLLINVYKIVFFFPIPILLAIMLNEVRITVFKRSVQTIIYLPHFISWVVVSGMMITILSPNNGLVNIIIKIFGGESISFLMNKNYFRSILVLSSIWKEAGWSAIVFLAAITGIDMELYDSAKVDGAGRIKQIIHITLPGLLSTIVLMLIMRLGRLLVGGVDQVLMLYNPVVYEVGDIIQTFVYRMGLGKSEYSFTTAVGLFDSVIGFILIISGNKVSKNLLGKSIW